MFIFVNMTKRPKLQDKLEVRLPKSNFLLITITLYLYKFHLAMDFVTLNL